uniref:Uncharacterized protein n=1 Tax=Lepeophtheirus salmonis TaxID=72036 RepID=A0A0K2V4D4_LEPSM
MEDSCIDVCRLCIIAKFSYKKLYIKGMTKCVLMFFPLLHTHTLPHSFNHVVLITIT